MENYGASPSRDKNLVAAPKDFLLGPVFAARKQTGPRDITIGRRRYEVGGFHPMRPDFHPPALDVRHARAVFTLLSFRNPNENSPFIRFSFREFCRRYAKTNGGRYARAIKAIVADLIDSYIRVTDLDTCISRQYRLIERLEVEGRPPRRKDSKLARSNQQEMFFNGCTLSQEFFGLLGQITELRYLRLDVLTAIRSPLAQAIYLYIPSRAHHHSEANPFEITLANLLEQVSHPVPRHKSVRHKLFTQHAQQGHSIMQQLDTADTLTGVFRLRLAETSGGTDWKLQAWVEQRQRSKTLSGDSKLIAAWLHSGRTLAQLERRLANLQALSDYEMGLLEMAAVRLAGNERFFMVAKAMLNPGEFAGLLAEAKGDELEGRKAKKNPTARLIWRIKSAISAAVRPGQGVDN